MSRLWRRASNGFVLVADGRISIKVQYVLDPA
jgi:hypothetical protein